MASPVACVLGVVVLVSVSILLVREKGLHHDSPLIGRRIQLHETHLKRQTTLQDAAAAAAAAAPGAVSVSAVAHTHGALDNSLVDLIQRLPKAELHIHIEGTLEADMMLRFAARNNVTLPYADLAEAQAARENFTDLQSFLDAYQTGLTVLKTEQDFYELAAGYLEKAAANNITHAEIFYDLQSHIKRSVPVSAVVPGLQRALTERASHPNAPVSATLILCLVRELGEAAAAAALALSLPYLSSIQGLGLASTELGYPPEDYKGVYTAAGLLGLHKVAHAGEEAGPDYVWGAIKTLGAQRIDHGIHSLDDPQLVHYMASHALPVTLCPISNTKLQVYGTQLPERLRQMLTCGIPITINSDDPAYFGAYLDDNFAFVASLAGLGPDDLAALAHNSFNASFIPPERKDAAHKQIKEVLNAWKAEQQQQQLHQQVLQHQQQQDQPLSAPVQQM